MRRKQLKKLKKQLTTNLYHYTSIVHLDRIMKSGYLKLTESNLRGDVELYKPVVWLTNQKYPNAFSLGLSGSSVDKTEIMFHIEHKKHFKSWNKFKKENTPLDNKWITYIEHNREPNTWYISEKEIYLSDVKLIENRYTNEVYYKMDS